MSIQPKEENFKVWCQAEITKAIDPTTGAEIMRLGGIASTSDKDSDDEFLDPAGFDLKPFMESGMVNWHHQAKGQPAAIIGEPSKAEIRPEGLYVEVDLYPDSDMAKQVYKLAETLDKNSKKRKLGFSIEGKVNKRKSNDKKSLDFKHILKAAVTGLAITHMPKNPKTFADIIKGNVDVDNSDDDRDEDEENEEKKALDTESGAALKRESVDGVPKKTFSKSEVIEKLFLDVPYISIEKAEKIYQLIKKISTMTKRKVVSDTDIEKAYELLGMSVEPTDAINKGGEGEETADEGSVEEKEESEEKTPKPSNKKDDEDEEENDEKEVKKGGVNRFDNIEKAIATSHVQTKSFLKALGVLIKDSSQKLDDASNKLDAAAARELELVDIIKAQDETISVISEKLEMFGNATPAPKSIRNAGVIERNFQKGQETEELAPAKKNVISMSKGKTAIVQLLDEATFAKGYDNEFGDALMHFEATGNLPANVITRLKAETGYEIVK